MADSPFGLIALGITERFGPVLNVREVPMFGEALGVVAWFGPVLDVTGGDVDG